MDKIRIEKFRRSRHLPYEELFMGLDVNQDVKPQWSDVYVAFHRFKFVMAFEVEFDHDDHLWEAKINDIMDSTYKWCNEECRGLWTDTHDDDSDDFHGGVAKPEYVIHFELEEDLERFTRECAVPLKLAH